MKLLSRLNSNILQAAQLIKYPLIRSFGFFGSANKITGNACGVPIVRNVLSEVVDNPYPRKFVEPSELRTVQ